MDSSGKKNKNIVREAFRNTIEADIVDTKHIARYFSADYVQHVDGKTLDYDDFVRHLHEQRKTISSIRVSFLTMASEGELVFTNHLVSVQKKDGNAIEGKVLAQFTVRNGKIVACDELTHIIGGSETDKDLGSRS